MSRILVVEDDEVLRNELIELLRNEGYEAEYISTFSDTAGQIIKSKPDLVLLDIKQRACIKKVKKRDGYTGNYGDEQNIRE